MDIHILFGQLYEDYPGQYKPSPIEIISEYDLEESPKYLKDKMAEWEKSGEYAGLAIVVVTISEDTDNMIRRMLLGTTTVQGKVNEPSA
jgi:hypothetical protein